MVVFCSTARAMRRKPRTTDRKVVMSSTKTTKQEPMKKIQRQNQSHRILGSLQPRQQRKNRRSPRLLDRELS
jgi:hypothetical protein